MKLLNPYTRYPEYNCFGCAPNNPVGLKMEFELRNNAIHSNWTPSSDFQGFYQILHGGIVAAAIDEIASWAMQVLCKTSGFTSEIQIKYLKPVYIEKSPLKLEARVESIQEKHAIIQVQLWDNEHTLCSTAKVDYYLFSEELARSTFYYPGVDSFFEN